MRSLPSPLRGLAFAIPLLAGILPGTSHATLIAIYSRPGEPLPPDPAASMVQALKGNPATTIKESYTLLTSDSSVLTPEFSVPPGVSAYFWSTETFRHRGFTMKGAHVTFDRDSAIQVKFIELMEQAATPTDTILPLTVDGAVAGATRLLGASRESNGLNLRYTLSKPGHVSVEVYELNGRNVGRWNFTESSSGSFRRSVKFQHTSNGPHLLRWSAGGVHEVRPLPGF